MSKRESTSTPNFKHGLLVLLLATSVLNTPAVGDNRLTLQRTGENEFRVVATMQEGVAGLQFTLVASEGLTLNSVRNGAGISNDAFICASNALDERTIRVVILGRSFGDAVMGTRELLLASIQRTSSAGDPTIRLEGVVLADGQGKGLAATVAGLLWSETFVKDGVAGLLGNFPNPFNPSTVISYTLNEPRHVRLTVHDMLGRQVAEVVNGEQGAGTHGAPWMADTRTISSGVYFARLEVGNQVLVHRMAITH